jgi:hypothetical protein
MMTKTNVLAINNALAATIETRIAAKATLTTADHSDRLRNYLRNKKGQEKIFLSLFI